MTKLLEWPVVRHERLDGEKIFLGDIGWLLVRVSGTEEMLRVYAETTRAETTKRVLDEVCATVKKL